jgi:hypothetical protein
LKRENKTIHLLFGWGISGTNGAVNYLLKYHSNLLKEIKKGKHSKGQYFFAVPLDQNGNINRNIVDYTERMFGKSFQNHQ